MESIYTCLPHSETLKEKQYNNFSAAFAEFNEDYLRLLSQKAKKPAFSKIDEEYYYLRFNMGNNHYIILKGYIINEGKEFTYKVNIIKTTRTGYNRFFRLEEGKRLKWK